jgi:hypothetical protein
MTDAPPTPAPPGPTGPATSAAESRWRAHERVSTPATGLQVTAGLGALFTILGACVAWLAILAQRAEHEISGDEALIASFVIGGDLVLTLVVALLIWIGATRMKALRGRGLAIVAAFVALIPCFSPCCLLGLPFGIWALFVLFDEDVRRAFR